MSWFSPDPPRAQTDAEKQALFATESRMIGEGQIPVTASTPPSFMQRVFGRKEEQRAITSLPWNTGGSLPGPSATPGVDGALALGAVYSAVSLLARTVAGLPLHAYREVDGKKTELNQLPQLFDEPSVQGDLFDWLHRCMTSLAMWGNAYGLITNRDGFGYPTGIEWLSPEQVTILDAAYTGVGSFLQPIWRWRGRPIPKEDLVHIPWFTLPWRVRGLSPMGAYAASVNTGLGAQKFSSDWFDAGGVPPGTFKNAMKTVPPAEAAEVKRRLTDSIRSHQAIVYGADWDYNPIAVNPQEAQFVETMKLTATQVAVIYGVPPERVGGEKGSSMTYSNTEQESIDFVQFTILNYARKLESALFKLLPARQYVRFNLDALVRPDLMTRHKTYMIDRQMGLRNIDEIRDMENLPPLPNGEGKSYAPLLATGLAPDPDEAAPAPSGSDAASALSQVLNLPARKPYDASANGNGQRSMMSMQDPVTVHIHNTIPERQVTMEHHAGDVIVHPSPPAEVRLEQPITVHPADVQIPVTVTTPEVRVDAPVTVHPAAVQVPVTVQPANAPTVTVEAPVTVNTPEIHLEPADVVVQPPDVIINVPPAPPSQGVDLIYDGDKVIGARPRNKPKGGK